MSESNHAVNRIRKDAAGQQRPDLIRSPLLQQRCGIDPPTIATPARDADICLARQRRCDGEQLRAFKCTVELKGGGPEENSRRRESPSNAAFEHGEPTIERLLV